MEAKKMITKARAGLILDLPFFGSLALRLTVKEDPSCQTAWVDGKTLGYNPQWVESLSLEEVKAVLCHEVMHCAMQHQTRRQERKADRWNMASDHAINPIVKEAGLKIPEGALLDPAYRGKSAEEIYAHLPQDNSGKEESEDQQGGQGGDQAPGTSGNGQGQDDDQQQDQKKNDIQDEKQPNSDPGGMGEVRDAPGPEGQVATEADKKQMEQDWKVAVAQAATQQKSCGDLPGELQRMVEEIISPTVNWRELLRRFVDQAAKNDYCIAPETPVLTADLYWVRADSLCVGQKLIGVDEFPRAPGVHRRVCESTVEGITITMQPRIRIQTDHGIGVLVSDNHRFLCVRNGHQTWRTARTLSIGDQIKMLVSPWHKDYSDSWLAGMFDGEGTLTSNKYGKPRAGLNLSVSQNDGPVLERIQAELVAFQTRIKSSNGISRYSARPCRSVCISAIDDVIRWLGQYRPTRLLPIFNRILCESRLTLPRPGRTTITAITTLDPGPVISIKTTTATLITNGLISHNCWFPPNRRHVHNGLYLPSVRSEELGKVVVAVDTSGSIHQQELDQFAGELNAILEDYKADCKVIYCDSQIAGIEEFTADDLPLQLEPRGGGGTNFKPPFDHLEDEDENPACFIYFTDGQCSQFPEEPAYPVLWACTEKNFQPPFGETVEVIAT